MRVLYVTPLWSGLRDALFNGSPARGMPAFIQPLKALLTGGHDVHIIVAVPPNTPGVNIGEPWLQRATFSFVPWTFQPRTKGVLAAIRLFRTVRTTLRARRFDFVYGHGGLGGIATLAANMERVPVGTRIYGTFLAGKLATGELRLALTHPLEWLTFKARSRFTLITNDGTRGDEVFQQLAPKRKDALRYWLNGVAPREVPAPHAESRLQSDCPFLFYPARVAPWKRQHLAVELLAALHQHGHRALQLILAGHVTDTQYLEQVLRRADELGVGSNVRYVGAITQLDMTRGFVEAIATLSLYDVSNLGNVVIEALSAGAVVLASDDGSLNGIVVDGHNGYLASDIAEAATRLDAIIATPERASEMRLAAKASSAHLFPTWDARVTKELKLIADTINAG